MVVYVEYVLIDNFLIDYLLLKGTFSITNTKTTKTRLFICSGLGCVFALLYPLICKNNLIQLVVKLLFGLVLVRFGIKDFCTRKLYVCSLVFLCYTFLVGGAIFGVGYLTGIDFTTEFSIALLTMPVFVVYKCCSMVIRYAYRKRHIVTRTYKVKVLFNRKSILADGFLDTGNLLYDGDNPVILCTKSFAEKFFVSGGSIPKIKFISVETVNGISQKPSFKIEQLEILNEDKKNIFNNVTMCVVQDSAILDGEIILHPKLMEGFNERQIV